MAVQTDIQPVSLENFSDLAFSPPSAFRAQNHLSIDPNFSSAADE